MLQVDEEEEDGEYSENNIDNDGKGGEAYNAHENDLQEVDNEILGVDEIKKTTNREIKIIWR